MARTMQCIVEDMKEAADKAANLEILNDRIAQDLRGIADELADTNVDLNFVVRVYLAALKLERGV